MNIKLLHPDAVVPKYAKEGDSGFDLVAVEDVIIEPGETKVIPTGLAFDIPKGYEIQVRPRSGVTAKTKLRVAFGTVDSGYRGEVGVTVDNIDHAMGWNDTCPKQIDGNFYHGLQEGVKDSSYIVKKGDRIAQAVIVPIFRTDFNVVDELSETDRGAAGYGSTGVRA
jgi:dUTP pyrophosphatase